MVVAATNSSRSPNAPNDTTVAAGARVPAGTTRERLVDAARLLFLTQGYEGTGVAEVLGKAGVNSGSLYHFFKTKEDLLLAVLDQYVEMLHPIVIEPVCSRVSDPIHRVFGILEGYRRVLITTEYREGCPIGNLALEVSEKSPAVRDRIATNFSNWRKAIRQCLLDVDDRFAPGTDCDKLATFILAVMEGGVMQARVHQSLEPFDASIAILRDYVDRLLEWDGE